MWFVRSFIVARVPVTYVSAADEVRMRWLKPLQDQGKLLMCRCPLGGTEEAFMWLIACATPAVKRIVVKKSGLVEDIV